MAASLEPPLPAPSINNKHSANHTRSCPSCGTSLETDISEAEAARRQVVELEAQMELLKEKTTTAVDRCADYEDQIRSLKMAQHRNKPLPPNGSDDYELSRSSNEDARPATAGATASRPSRFSFLTGRRLSPNNFTSQPPPSTSSTPIDIELLNELERERTLRAKAEARVQTVDSEIEELSVQLFSQANEMVATERRERAKLEERIALLEKKDKDKMARLERLEKAITRLDRVKAMLNQPSTTTTMTVGSGMLSPPPKR